MRECVAREVHMGTGSEPRVNVWVYVYDLESRLCLGTTKSTEFGEHTKGSFISFSFRESLFIMGEVVLGVVWYHCARLWMYFLGSEFSWIGR